jgi:putative transferase (TIGR04331 family)
MASQCLVSLELVLGLYSGLNEEVRRHVRIKPQADQGWNTAARYEAAVGAGRMLRVSSIQHAFRMSRLVVCTYPETTFAEAMVSGRPTIMLYPDALYERNPVAFPLLERLRTAKIVFHDSARAAAHINAIWGDPDRWWNSPAIVTVRDEFRRQAARLDGDWVDRWTSFVHAVAESA